MNNENIITLRIDRVVSSPEFGWFEKLRERHYFEINLKVDLVAVGAPADIGRLYSMKVPFGVYVAPGFETEARTTGIAFPVFVDKETVFNAMPFEDEEARLAALKVWQEKDLQRFRAFPVFEGDSVARGMKPAGGPHVPREACELFAPVHGWRASVPESRIRQAVNKDTKLPVMRQYQTRGGTKIPVEVWDVLGYEPEWMARMDKYHGEAFVGIDAMRVRAGRRKLAAAEAAKAPVVWE